MLRFSTVILLVLAASPASAAVVTITNNTDQAVSFSMTQGENPPLAVKLSAGETKAVPVGRNPALTVTLTGKPETFQLDPYTAYIFFPNKNQLTAFQGLQLVGELPKPTDVPITPTAIKPYPLTVHLLVDDAEPRSQPSWEKVLRARLGSAGEVLEKQCGVALTVAETGEWKSDPKALDLVSRHESFELVVPAKPGILMLGAMTRSLKSDALFGTMRSPWTSHLLIREGVPKTEGERTEMLLHHLGLYLGAVRTADPNSVMRLKLNDGRANRTNFQLAFDPLNLLVIHIWAEERRAGRSGTWDEICPAARDRLLVLYRTQAKLHDELKQVDGQAKAYADTLEILKLGEKVAVLPRPDLGTTGGDVLEAAVPVDPKPAEPATGNRSAKEEGVRAVVQAISKKAAEVDGLPVNERPIQDALTEAYIRTAAAAANKLEEAVRIPAFLIGLGIGLDNSTILSNNPLTKKLCAAVESAEERQERLAKLGTPTMHQRRDLCQHFAVSVALTEIVGAGLAELAGVTKELADMKGTSGFSFADLGTDLAGIEFAGRIQKTKLLDSIAKEFAVVDYVPDIKGLREGLSESRFEKDFGSITDVRYTQELESLRKRVREVKAYKK